MGLAGSECTAGRSGLLTRERGRPTRSTVRRRAGADSHRVAQLRLLFEHAAQGATTRYAFVRLYKRDEAELSVSGMPSLRWNSTAYAGGAAPHYEVVKVADIVRPVLLQPHPVKAGCWLWNYFVQSPGR